MLVTYLTIPGFSSFGRALTWKTEAQNHISNQELETFSFPADQNLSVINLWWNCVLWQQLYGPLRDAARESGSGRDHVTQEA